MQIRFTGEEKVLQKLPINPTVEDFFKFYITEEMIDHLVVQTNLYARQFLDEEKDNIYPDTRAHEWNQQTGLKCWHFSYTISEGYCAKMKTYNVLVNRQHFGSTNLQSSYEEGQISSCQIFHFADNIKYNPADPDRDKLYKIREVINMTKVRCCKVYSPRKSFSMDESLVLFKERLSFKLHISSERARHGIKLYQLCIFSSILLDFFLYHGNLVPGLISLETVHWL